MAFRNARWWSICPVAGLFVLACMLACSSSGSSDGDGGAAAATSATIFASNFTNFCSWPNADATASNDASDGIHGLGPLRVYWNQPPPHGSQTFPVGTLILKESEEADPTQRTIFAMAKVGGGYNAAGAVGWEWFSFKQNPDCSVIFLWSGEVAPPGETYAGQPVGDCNGCHAQANNDFVWDTALQLSNF